MLVGKGCRRCDGVKVLGFFVLKVRGFVHRRVLG